MRFHKQSLFSCLVALALLFVVPVSRGFGGYDVPDMVTDRPDFTESAEIVPLGSLQIEAGYTFSEIGGENEHALGELLLRLGAMEWLELRFGLNSWVWAEKSGDDASGRDDMAFEVKIKLVESTGEFSFFRPDLALILGTSIPSGDSDYREDRFQPLGRLALAWAPAERLNVGINLGYTRASDSGRYYDKCSESIALGFSIDKRFGVFVEFIAFQPVERDGFNAHYVDAGFTFLLLDSLQLDARGGYLIDPTREEYFVGIGLVARILNIF